jgi:hypothetical protein
MQAQSDSSETGTATLTSVDATKTKVTLQLENAPAGPQPAHIHTGNGPKPGAVKYPLTNVEKGTSETTVAASLDDLLALVARIRRAWRTRESTRSLRLRPGCSQQLERPAFADPPDPVRPTACHRLHPPAARK